MNIKLPFLIFIILSSCNSGTETKNVSNSPATAMPAVSKDSSVPAQIILKESDLADKKDLVCGMPAFRYLGDTANYNGKIYGFCSKDCKDEFLKDPASYLVKK
jgi:YHS domain-containing protein